MRAAVALVFVAACGPAPASALPEPAEPLAAEPGVAVFVRVHPPDELLEGEFVIGDDGSIDISLCGRVAVGGADARAIEAQLAACLEEFFVSPQVWVELREPTAPGTIRTTVSAPEADLRYPTGEAAARLSALLARDPIPPHDLLARLIRAEAERIALRVEYEPRHPRMVRRARRVAELYAAVEAAAAPGDAAQTHAWLQRAKVDAQRHRSELATQYGANHPDLIRATEVLAFYGDLLRALEDR